MLSQGLCPGAFRFIQPQIVLRSCPNCGEEVEFFEYDVELQCPKCKRPVRKEIENTCLMWCQHVDKCLADIEARGLLTRERVNELKAIGASKRKS